MTYDQSAGCSLVHVDILYAFVFLSPPKYQSVSSSPVGNQDKHSWRVWGEATYKRIYESTRSATSNNVTAATTYQ